VIIVYIKGSHDKGVRETGNIIEVADHKVVNFNGVNVMLVHDPNNRNIADWDGWVIHGHLHNTPLVRRPLIDFHNCRVNVSVEVIGYRPISMNTVLRSMTRLIVTRKCERVNTVLRGVKC
jgi:calcineurin-like phosphoesterase family protein